MQHKKKGRRRGSKNKGSAEVTKKLGDATLYYAHGCYEEVWSFSSIYNVKSNVLYFYGGFLFYLSFYY